MYRIGPIAPLGANTLVAFFDRPHARSLRALPSEAQVWGKVLEGFQNPQQSLVQPRVGTERWDSNPYKPLIEVNRVAKRRRRLCNN
jgi:hypothetical protein